MIEAKLLRKKLKNGLIVDKWDLVTIIEKQQAEIEALKGCELTDEEIRHIQAQCHLKDVGYDNFIMRFARAILRKAQEK
jgi:hypothetical protein